MLSKVLTLLVRGVVRGPAKSWVFTSGALSLLKLVQRTKGRREIIDLSQTKPGDKIIIEHLSITHKEQIRDEKHAKKAGKKASKAEKKAVRAAKRGR